MAATATSSIARRLASPLLRNLALLGGLLLLSQFHPLARYGSVLPPPARAMIHRAGLRGMNVEDQSRQTAGYYEGLLQEGGRVAGVGSLIAGRAAEEAQWRESLAMFSSLRMRDDFLVYEFTPGAQVGPEGTRANSFGMTDDDVPLAKPAGTFRIALIGDSLVRGLGVRREECFEALFEQWLNRERRPDGPIAHYDVLNFGVDGYRITQSMEVALTKAVEFEPDAYLIAVTELSVLRKWSDHLARLLHDGIDLRHDFLRQVVASSGARGDDAKSLLESKLEPHRMEVMGGVVATIAAHAQSRHAGLAFVFVPTASPIGPIRGRFAELATLVDQSGQLRIDLLETFASRGDFEPYRISFGNTHPNAAGHRLLFEALAAAVSGSPRLRREIAGDGLR